jgi:hypothetical protein
MGRSEFGRLFFGDDRVEAPPGSGEPEATAGWYPYAGGLRFFDGEGWTLHFAPPAPSTPSLAGIAAAVFAGVLAALVVVWIGAQISPEHIYVPVKFVVKELPSFR